MRVPAAARALRAIPVRGLLGLTVLCGVSFAAEASVDCATLKPQAPSVPGNVLQGLPLASELAAPDAQVGSGVGFAQLFAEGTTVELVLARARHSECLATAVTTQPLSGAYQPPASNDPQAWRFNMTQNGKRMTADEFDAWMKARGVRVVQGPKPAAPPPPPPPPPEPPKKKKR